MHGGHLIKSYAKTQVVLALSSGEAELYSLVRASCEGLGMMAMARDLGHEKTGSVYTDASAALGIVGRAGLGRLRHIDVQHLWVQRCAAEKALLYNKIGGSINPADAATKSVEGWRLKEHMERVGLTVLDGRATSVPELRQ